MKNQQTVPSSPAGLVIHNIQTETDQKLKTVQIQSDKQVKAFTTVPSSATVLIATSKTQTPVPTCYSSKFPHKTSQSTCHSSSSYKSSPTSSSHAGALGNNTKPCTHNNNLSNIIINSNKNHHNISRKSQKHIHFNNLSLWKAKRPPNDNRNIQTSLAYTLTPSSLLIRLYKHNRSNNRSKKIKSEVERNKNQVGGGNSTARRIFTAEFKKSVVDAFTHDPECVGNQRATARKFRIHRRQVQKWIQQRPVPTPTIKVSPPDAIPKTKGISSRENSGLKSSNPNTSEKSMMSNAINALLSLRDVVRVNASWSAQTPPLSTALNLALLGNSGTLHNEMESSPPLQPNITPNGHKLNNFPFMDGCFPSPRRSSPQSATSTSPPSRNQTQNNQGSKSGSSNQHSSSTHTYTNLTNGHHGNDMEHLTPSEILDELGYLYPQEDFTLLRNACLKNEITLTKLSKRLSYGGYPSTLTPSPSASASRPNSNDNGNGNGNSGNNNEYNSLQELLKQQQNYAQFIQHYQHTFPNVFPSDMTASTLNLSNLTEQCSSKYSQWFNPFAQVAVAAAAAAMPIPAPAGSGSINGTGKKKSSADQHMFLSPKIPISSSKPKTVAAALAASRHSPNMMGTIVGNGKSSGKKPAAPRKRQQRQGKTSTITRPPVNLMDDDIDPMSMLEITTNPPPEYGGMDLSTTASYSYKSNDNMSSTATANYRRSNSKSATTSSYSVQSNLMNSDMLTSPQIHSPNLSPPNTTKRHISSKHNGLAEASHCMDTVSRKHQAKSPPTNPDSFHNLNTLERLSESLNLAPISRHSMTLNPSTSTAISEFALKKQKILEAFHGDSVMSGDKNGVAKTMQLGRRTASKLLLGGPSKSLPAISPVSPTKPINGGINLSMDPNQNSPMFSIADLQQGMRLAQQHEDSMSNGDGDSHHSGSSKSTGSISSANASLNLEKKKLPNKRKNKKPNQICDFQHDDLAEDSESIPLDMVVPIKKRRVSNSNNSS